MSYNRSNKNTSITNAKWFYLSTGACSGVFNMALDNYLLLSMEQGVIHKPLLRTYGWSEKTISVGKSQKHNLELYKNEFPNLQIVDRITGGQAVVHGVMSDELTYSVFLCAGMKFKHLYFEVGKALLKFLSIYGLYGDYGYSSGNYKTHFNCFESKTQADIVVNNEKIIGSAQCRKKGFVLQHGTIRLDLINCLSGKCISHVQAEKDLKSSFTEVFNIQFESFPLFQGVYEKIDSKYSFVC